MANILGLVSRRAHSGPLFWLYWPYILLCILNLWFGFSLNYAILTVICKIFCLKSVFRVIRPFWPIFFSAKFIWTCLHLALCYDNEKRVPKLYRLSFKEMETKKYKIYRHKLWTVICVTWTIRLVVLYLLDR